ncbi:hypothetical protein GPB2148_2052 [marine gamma proteobacterium HTCC2148]|jgi:hypothetical protein|nr:hypothetical protein GPB2148_2052 [marine gamma proteobacterium HTCC2148]MBT3410266.1 hypothetical protein [Halieaceae bacterium]MBT5007624.1 hypothetical protein [Halieaceae bacterium]
MVFAPLLLFGLAGIYFLSYFLRVASEGAVQENLLPELIGFCLEGFFIVGLFSLVQRRMERDRRHELRQSLRGALRDVLSHLDVALLEKNAEPTSSQSLERDPKVAAILFQKLNRVELNLDDMAKLKSAAERGYGVTRDLIPVAAQLSAEHMRWWLAITNSVRHLSESTDRAAVTFAAHKFLIHLGEFDELHL